MIPRKVSRSAWSRNRQLCPHGGGGYRRTGHQSPGSSVPKRSMPLISCLCTPRPGVVEFRPAPLCERSGYSQSWSCVEAFSERHDPSPPPKLLIGIFARGTADPAVLRSRSGGGDRGVPFAALLLQVSSIPIVHAACDRLVEYRHVFGIAHVMKQFGLHRQESGAVFV